MKIKLKVQIKLVQGLKDLTYFLRQKANIIFKGCSLPSHQDTHLDTLVQILRFCFVMVCQKNVITVDAFGFPIGAQTQVTQKHIMIYFENVLSQ